MASLWMDHFGQYYNGADMLQGCWAAISGDWALSTANPPRAGASHVRGTGGGMLRTLLSAKTVAGWATRNYLSQLPALEGETSGGSPFSNHGYAIRVWKDGVGNVQLTTLIGTDGAIAVYSGFPSLYSQWAAARLARSAQCIFPRTYHHIEDRITVDSSTGSYELRVDGVTRINISGINTDPTSVGNVAQVGWDIFDATGSGVGVTADIVDVHHWDDQAGEGLTDFGGNLAVLQRPLNQDTADAGWSLSTGSSGYGLLIDKNASTYIEAGSTTLKSGFKAASAPAGTSGIVAQQLSFRGLKTDGGDCDVAPSFKSGSSESTVTGQPMNMGEVWKWGIVGTDPATSAPWTPTGVNNSEAALTRTL